MAVLKVKMPSVINDGLCDWSVQCHMKSVHPVFFCFLCHQEYAGMKHQTKITILRTNPLEKGIDNGHQVGSTLSFFCLPVGLFSSPPYFPSSPLYYVVGTCVVPTLSPLAGFCHQGFRAAAHCALVGDRGAFRSSAEIESWGEAHPFISTG